MAKQKNTTTDEVESILEKIQGIDFKNLVPFNVAHLIYQEAERKADDVHSQIENLHSDIFAEIFKSNPEYIKLFIKQVDSNIIIPQSATFTVTRERIVKCQGSKRIDIFIEWNNNDKKCALIIENKLYGAKDQENQLNRYYLGIKKEGYLIEKIVYMQLDTGILPNDTKEYVKRLTHVFDVDDIIKWLDEIPYDCNCIIYKEMFECIKQKKYIIMKANEILDKLNNQEVAKLFEVSRFIKRNPEIWCEARFRKLFKVPPASSIESTLFSGTSIDAAKAKVEYCRSENSDKKKGWGEIDDFIDYMIISYDNNPKRLIIWLYTEKVSVKLISNKNEKSTIKLDQEDRNRNHKWRYFREIFTCSYDDNTDQLLLKGIQQIISKTLDIQTT